MQNTTITTTLGNRVKATWARVRPGKLRVPRPESSILVLCGRGRRLHPETVKILTNAVPGHHIYIFAGLEGANCHANFRNSQWPTRCFGTPLQFAGVIMESCDYAIHNDVLRMVKNLVRPGGFFLYVAHDADRPPRINGFRLGPKVGWRTTIYLRTQII